MKRVTVSALATLIMLCGVTTVWGKPLVRQLLELESGWAHFSYDPRPEVSGNCDLIRIDSSCGIDHTTVRFQREHQEDGPTFRGPVHVQLRIRRGELIHLDTCIGDSYELLPSDQMVDFGHISPAEAAETLLILACEDGPDAEDCILPATLAQGFDRWQTLLDIARERRYSHDLRRQAIFWLGDGASVAATRGLKKLIADDDEELEIREQAIFALSRQETDEYVPLLMEIARSNPHPQLRRSALFWLAQSDDDRALGLFEEILLAD